jgi:hypothetical protein
MKKSKKVIYLSLSDLKELGIIKKRKSTRRRRHGKATYLNPNTRSASDHMVGYSMPTQFMNTSNLQSDNLRLNNLLLENKLKEEPPIKNLDNSQIDTLQKAVDKQQNNYYYITGLMEQNRFNQQPTHTSPFNSAYVDNIENDNDVPSTFGSDFFKSQETYKVDNNTQNESFSYDNIFKPTADTIPNNVQDNFNEIDESQLNEEPVKGPPPIEEVLQKPVKEMIQELNKKTEKKDFDTERQTLRDELKEYNLDFDSIKNNQSAMKSMLTARKREIATAIGQYTELCEQKNEKRKPSIIKSKDLETIKKAIKKLQK